jgi:hypothetical protein
VTVVSRSLDDLDRLAFRLSRTVRTQYPQLLTQGFTLSDLEERLLPFREVRREMADSGADAFESALLRLLAGERGYLNAEPELQSACKQALRFPSPALAMVRSWTTSSVMLAAPAGASSTRATPAATEVFPQPSGAPSAADATETPKPRPAHASCRYCASRLPENRKVTFCPHCGLDLTKRQCPACSTELEVHWRFCVTCGRSG